MDNPADNPEDNPEVNPQDVNMDEADPTSNPEEGDEGLDGIKRLLTYEMSSRHNAEHHIAWSARHKIQPPAEDGRTQLFYSKMSVHRAQQMYRASRDYLAQVLSHCTVLQQQRMGVLVDGNVHVPDFHALKVVNHHYPVVVVYSDPNFVGVSPMTARDHDFFPADMFVPERQQKYYKDSQHFYGSARSKQPVDPLPGRGPENHFVPLARLCYSCCKEFTTDQSAMFSFSQLRNGVITVVNQPRSDGLTVLQPQRSISFYRNQSTGKDYAFDVEIFGDECTIEVGQLALLICGRRGLLVDFSFSNLMFTMLQTDGQRLCVRYTEILAPIKSPIYDPIVTDADGTEMRVGDAVSLYRHGRRFGQIWEIMDNDVYVDVDCPIYGQKFIVSPANEVFKTIQSILYQNNTGTNDLSVPPTFDTEIVTLDGLMQAYGDPDVRLLIDRDLAGCMLFVHHGYVAYCTRLSMDTAFFMLLGDKVQRALPIRHVQQPPSIFIENHLRAARAANGALIVRGANVVRFKDNKNLPLPSYVECAFCGWLALRPHITFTMRPFVIEKGENVMLIDDYFAQFKSTHTEPEIEQEKDRLDSLLLGGMTPICFDKFKEAYPDQWDEIDLARRQRADAPFIDRAMVVIQVLIDQFKLPRSRSDYTSRRRRSVPYVSAFAHFLQPDAVVAKPKGSVSLAPADAPSLRLMTHAADGTAEESDRLPDDAEILVDAQNFADKLFLVQERQKILSKSMVREDESTAKAAAVAAATAVPRYAAPSASSSQYYGDVMGPELAKIETPKVAPCTINVEDDSEDEEDEDLMWADDLDLDDVQLQVMQEDEPETTYNSDDDQDLH